MEEVSLMNCGHLNHISLNAGHFADFPPKVMRPPQRRARSCDFRHLLGREGIDLRVDERATEDYETDAVTLTAEGI